MVQHPLQLLIYPGTDIAIQDAQRYRAFTQHLVVKCADIEFLAQFFLGVSPQLLDLEFADLVSQRLARPDDVAINFDHDIMF